MNNIIALRAKTVAASPNKYACAYGHLKALIRGASINLEHGLHDQAAKNIADAMQFVQALDDLALPVGWTDEPWPADALIPRQHSEEAH